MPKTLGWTMPMSSRGLFYLTGTTADKTHCDGLGRPSGRRLRVGEHGFDAWPVGGPEHLVRRVTGNRQTEPDALGRRDGGGPRLGLRGQAKDQLAGVQDRVVEVGVGSCFKGVE